MALVPLQQWICDRCGGIIKSPEAGWLEWLHDESRIDYGFKIVHHYSDSPKQPDGDCYHYTDHPDRNDNHLKYFLGNNGLITLLSFLDVGIFHQRIYRGPKIRNVREFVEIIRRLHVPYYEEARLYWANATSDGFFDSLSEVSIYSPENLTEVIDKYSIKQRYRL